MARRKKSKKAQGLPMNVIVTAVLVLVILVVLLVLFSGKIGEGGKKISDIGDIASEDIISTDKCETLFSGRVCISSAECTKKSGFERSSLSSDCKDSALVCCDI